MFAQQSFLCTEPYYLPICELKNLIRVWFTQSLYKPGNVWIFITICHATHAIISSSAPFLLTFLSLRWPVTPSSQYIKLLVTHFYLFNCENSNVMISELTVSPHQPNTALLIHYFRKTWKLASSGFKSGQYHLLCTLSYTYNLRCTLSAFSTCMLPLNAHPSAIFTSLTWHPFPALSFLLEHLVYKCPVNLHLFSSLI